MIAFGHGPEAETGIQQAEINFPKTKKGTRHLKEQEEFEEIAWSPRVCASNKTPSAGFLCSTRSMKRICKVACVVSLLSFFFSLFFLFFLSLRFLCLNEEEEEKLGAFEFLSKKNIFSHPTERQMGLRLIS